MEKFNLSQEERNKLMQETVGVVELTDETLSAVSGGVGPRERPTTLYTTCYNTAKHEWCY